MSVYVAHNTVSTISYKNSDSWITLNSIEQSIKKKIEKVGVPLKDWDISINYGIKTGLNDAFIISTEKKDELIAADPKSAEIIRPILRGRDIFRYDYKFADLWLIFVPWHFPLQYDESIVGSSTIAEEQFKSNYPAVYNHLLQYKAKLLKRNKAETGIRYEWYALQRWGSKYWNDFSERKIMYNDICQKLSFSLVPKNIFCVNTVYFIKDNADLTYLLACLNSKVTDWYYRTLSVQLGTKAVRMFSIYVEQLPIPKLEGENYALLSHLAELLSSNKESSDLDINSQIDDILYKAFDFTKEEINIIEENYN